MTGRPLGAGVVVSPVGLGGYELGGGGAHELSVAQAANLIAKARGAGITWIDTAEIYGKTGNEALIGAALRLVGGDVLVSSKVAPSPAGTGFRPEQVSQACRNSLRRLGRQRIDVYFMHWRDGTGIPPEETWGALAQLADDGLVGAIGLSNHDHRIVERCHAERRVDVVQTGLSLLDYAHNRRIIRRFHGLGIAAMIYEPLACGLLTGRSPESIREEWAVSPDTWGSYLARLLGPETMNATSVTVDGVRRIAIRTGMSPAQLAIAWVLHQPGVTVAIAGSRSAAHIQENATAADVELSPAIIAELETLLHQPEL